MSEIWTNPDFVAIQNPETKTRISDESKLRASNNRTFVVYFDQGLGAAHPKRWSKQSF